MRSLTLIVAAHINRIGMVLSTGTQHLNGNIAIVFSNIANPSSFAML